MLRDPAFRVLFCFQVLTGFASNSLFLSLGVWAKDLTGSNSAAGLVFFCVVLPVAFGPLVGYAVDHLRRKSVLLTVNCAAVVLVPSLLLVRAAADLWLIYVVAGAYGLAAVFLRSAQAGVLKTVIAHDDLAVANAYLRSAGEVMRVVSPLFGVGLYAFLGGHALALVVAAVFLLAAVTLRRLRITEAAPGSTGAPQSVVRRIGAGLTHLWSQPRLVVMTTAIGLAFGVVGFFDSSDFAVVGEGLGKPASFLGVLTSVQGVGSVAGGVTAALLIRRLGETATSGAGLVVMALGALGMTQHAPAVVFAAFAAFGVGVPWLVVGYTTAWQRDTPSHLVGRVATAADLSILGPQALSIPIGALLIEVVPYRVLLTVCFAVLLAAGVTLTVRRRTGVRPGATPESSSSAPS